jgi:hypothetical protein
MIDLNEDNICSIHNTNSDGLCLPKNIIVDLHQKIISTNEPKVSKEPKHIINELSSQLNCTIDKNVEVCIINNAPIEESEKITLKAEYFKPEGDIDPIAWLNNTNIDEVQEQLYKKYPNYYYSYIHMIDFIMHPPDNDVDHPIYDIKSIDFVKELKGENYKNKITVNGNEMKYYGVVFNTDPSTKSGQHWFAIFFNFGSLGTINDPYTLEYFNSSGEDIKNGEFVQFFKKLAVTISDQLNKCCKYIRVTKIQHQNTVTGNCGCYALGYIWDRLEGISYGKFNDPSNKITDDKYMSVFRKKLFRTVK